MGGVRKEEEEEYFWESLNLVEGGDGSRNGVRGVLELDERSGEVEVLVFGEGEGKVEGKRLLKLGGVRGMEEEFGVKVGRELGVEGGVGVREVVEKGEKGEREERVGV